MATTPESRFAQRVRGSLGGCDIERIENRVNLGVPDMLVGVDSRFVMVELKVVTSGLKVSLRSHQVAFATRHTAAGRPSFVLVKRDGGAASSQSAVPPDSIALYKGAAAIELYQQGLRLAPLAWWPSRTMDWSALRKLLATQ